MGRLGDLLTELRQDIEAARRDRIALIEAVPVNAEAAVNRDRALAVNDRHIERMEANLDEAMEERPIHQPLAPDAPIPGVHHYSGCSDDYPRVNPDGHCEGCGAEACSECGYEVCQCVEVGL